MALSECSDTAPGEDHLSFQMLKYPHIKSEKFSLSLYNDIFIQESDPELWNIAIDLPLLKPGKDPHDHNSYRPIALRGDVGFGDSFCRTV